MGGICVTWWNFVRVSLYRLRRTHGSLGSSSKHKTDEKERNDKIDNQKTEESPVSAVVPAPEEGMEIEAGDRVMERRPTVANRTDDTCRNRWGRNTFWKK